MYIEIINLTKKIRGNYILQNINLRFESGKIYGLKGKNGSGKTMLMRAICGLIKAEGTIDINGRVLGKDISFPESVGVLIENPTFISNYTGVKNLQVLASIQKKIDKNKIYVTLQNVGLDPNDRRTYRKYSLGMKQRLGIAAAVMEEPELILLDEPINALDETGVELVRQILKQQKERGAIILVACHDAEELESLSDEIIVISEGKIVSEG
ncbi:ABC transporter ATP-binding protein [[Clostridium] fimetarium]|uniref:ABC-2 type transport system ATP-binding protein n=1 Tax=[Clostridium] fimetarium TaxID=99656 RepID=A0A1I0RNV3_9FIRM|nr:ATP-binding cassette domain-containing protein [[Clostridium] fimetarium]SEW43023.1 ABC-2 type transport system ATP-binding protein [[Clostridium] fimetarium]